MNDLDLRNFRGGAGSAIKEDVEYKQFCTRRNLDKALNSLMGIIEGIKADNRIDILEQAEVANWIETQVDLRARQPFDEIIEKLHNALEDGILDREELDDIMWVCQRHLKRDAKYDLTTQALQQLQGLLHGISANNSITSIELRVLSEWISDNDNLSGSYPYDEIHSLVTSVLSDGIVTKDEEDLLRAYFGEFIDTTISCNVSKVELDKIRQQHSVQGVCALCPQIEVGGHLFCFTGKSSKTSRKEIADVVETHGGSFNNNVVSDTHYLVVGNESNSCWAYSCYGRKVEKAMEMRKQGAGITIVHENDFWDAMQE